MIRVKARGSFWGIPTGRHIVTLKYTTDTEVFKCVKSLYDNIEALKALWPA